MSEFDAFCPNPGCRGGDLHVIEEPAFYGTIYRITAGDGSKWQVAAPRPVCPFCGWALAMEKGTLFDFIERELDV